LVRREEIYFDFFSYFVYEGLIRTWGNSVDRIPFLHLLLLMTPISLSQRQYKNRISFLLFAPGTVLCHFCFFILFAFCTVAFEGYEEISLNLLFVNE